MSQKAKFVNGNVNKLLLFNSFPMLLGIGSILLFNFVDTVFIARLGTEELAAITFTFPFVFVVIGISMGISSGASAVISKAIGEGNHHRVKRLTTDAIILALILCVITIIVGLSLFEFLFASMGALPHTLELIKEYMIIWLPGTIFLIVPMVGNFAIRATGDIKTPSIIMLVATGVNIIMDPILIFGLGPIPQMGLAGAATATVISRFITLIVAFRILYYRDEMISLEKPKFSEVWESWKEILNIGLPSAITNIILPAGFGVITKFTSEFGEAAVAGLGAASRVESLVLTVYMALGAVFSPFIGQNWGALRFDRIKKAINFIIIFSLLWGLFMVMLFEIFKKDIAHFIKDDVAVIEVIILYLSITPISMAFRGIVMIATTGLSVLKKPILSSLINIAYMFIFFIPLAYYLMNNIGLEGIFWALVISAIVSATISYIMLIKRYNELKTEVST